MSFLEFMLFGLLIGAIARMVVTEKAGGWAFSLMSGAAGSLLGGLVARAGTFRSDSDSAAFGMSLFGAFALVCVYHAICAARRAPM